MASKSGSGQSSKPSNKSAAQPSPKGAASSRPAYPANKPSTTGEKSGGGRSNKTLGKSGS